MDGQRLFEGMDERERQLTPEQLPDDSNEALRVAADDAAGAHGATEIVIPVGGLLGAAGRGETPGVVGGPGPVMPAAPVVPFPPTPTDIPLDREPEGTA